uniref:CoA synthase n=1 Tax=Neogobius melanostomus TaxID=47308 RepID=A0A8C6SMM8_9GOBI
MSMFSTGILVLTSPLHTLPLRIAPVLSSAAQLVERTLYVHLHPGLNLGKECQARPVYIPPVVDLSKLITRLYNNAADICGHLDVRVLLTNVHAQSATIPNCPFPTPQPLSHSPEVVLTDFPVLDTSQTHQVTQCLQKYTGRCYVCSPALSSVLLHPQLVNLEQEKVDPEKPEETVEAMKTYNDVVVGGTFDRLHGAHRTLLNISCLLANRRFLIGVCDQAMLKRKVLKELIEPYSVRVEKLQEFLHDVKPSLEVEIVPLNDPLGVSVEDPLLECIVVSEETRKGGEAVNKKRIENGLPALVLHEIQLLKDAHRSEIEEEKISSSSLRTRLLGTLLTPLKVRLKALTDIVWPEIALIVKNRIQQAREEGKQVCVLDAAVLLEAGWNDMVHEVWVTVIPEEEAVSRITERDGVSTEDALRRLHSQWSNYKQVQYANVALTTLWEPEVTQKQVLKAWNLLQKRIQQRGARQ